MTPVSEELLELIERISDHPTLFASTPEVADGLVHGLAWAALREATGQSLADCVEEERAMTRRVTSDVGGPPEFIALLCEEAFPTCKRSFEAFRQHSKEFLELLQEHLES